MSTLLTKEYNSLLLQTLLRKVFFINEHDIYSELSTDEETLYILFYINRVSKLEVVVELNGNSIQYVVNVNNHFIGDSLDDDMSVLNNKHHAKSINELIKELKKIK